MRRGFTRFISFILVIVMVLGLCPQLPLAVSAAEGEDLVPLYQAITVQPGQLVGDTGEIIENEIYGYVVGYELKKGHTLSISNTDYVFSVRKLADGNYSTLLKQATTASYTATEDMTIGCLIRKPDKSALTAEELASIVLYDSQYGMIGVEGYAHRFTVEAETIDGGTHTTRAAIFLPPSYSESGTPTRLVIMTNGQNGHLRDNQWNANTADDVAVMKHYMDANYAVLVVDNTAGQTSNTSDLGCPQLVDSYFKAYQYAQENLNVEELFSLHSRSNGTFAAIRIMREHPELVKCALMTGAQFSMKNKFSMNSAFIADRFGFDDPTGATYEADKLVGYDAYTDVNGEEYSLPPTFWMLSSSDATTAALSTIEKIEAHGNDVTMATYTDTDHSGVCRLNIQQCWDDALAYLEAHQTSGAEHRFCAWETVKEATCTESGELRRNCADCSHYETMVLAQSGHISAENEEICTFCGSVLLDPLSQEVPVIRGQFYDSDGQWLDSDIYGCVIGYELKKGHTLSISDTNYVFAVRQLIGGNYNTMVKEANTDSFTATEDMTIAVRVRKPDKSALTAEELASIVLYDTQYGMLGLEGYAQRFTVEAETIDGGTATTRANIFLPASYSDDGEPTKLIVMTNGYSAYLTDSTWNGNTADNVGIIQNYLDAGYAVWVVDNTAAQTSQTPDLGCPQLVDSYFKAYEYIQAHFNVEEKFSIHSRSFGTFAAMRIMQEHPELVKCAVMTGPRVSIEIAWGYVDKAFVANRFGFADATGATYEADKLVGHDPYTDVDGESYALPPTFWMMCQGDATEEPVEVIEKLTAYGNDVTSKTYTGTNHTGICTLNTEEMFADALAFLEGHQEPETLEAKTISILGASISTFEGTSNGAAANTSNSTIGGNVKYYPNTTIPEVTLNDTWWMQVADDMGLELLVNNSWSGSSLLHERSGTVGAYVDRCVQLHDDTGDNAGEMPDIIGIQLGTNDFQYYKDTLGTADIDYDALITANGDGTYTYATPVTSLEAAAIVLHKISVRYPNAEVYYLNISQRVDGTDELIQSFNAELKQVVEHFGAHIVDIYGSAITMEDFDTYIGDGRVHPNKLGMDAYTEAFKRALIENTAYAVDTHTVTMKLDGVTADYGDDKIVVSGDSFTVDLTAADSLQVTVTMGGKDITEAVYANGTVTIAAVTDDVTLTAKSVHEPKNYRWEFDGTDLACVEGDNALTKNAGTTTDGVFSTTRYALDKTVVLSHDQPWVVEWKCEGTFLNTNGSSGARIFTSDDVNANYNARYLFKSNTNGLIAMGEKTTTGSHNYGIALGDHDIDWTALHTYRLENRIADDGSNMVYLYVDGVEIGAMNHYYVGTTSQGTTSDWLSGKDFTFPYMGTDTHGFTNCSIAYIQVYETTESLPLRYDDHYDVTGKAVEIIDAGTPTSCKVGYGVAEGTLDDAVVTLDGDTLVATGIGTARVRIDDVLYEITVEAAPISLLLLAGQSNMQGSEGNADQSIICPDGMVYATYGDRYTMTADNATNFAPSALTGEGSALNVNGTTTNLADWPVCLLNEAGAGKAGPDSGYAWEWVQQTGEKVWIVNAAHGGSSITTWQDGGANYEEAVLLFSACQETLRQEIAAGHYTLSHMGYFWCQGCTDETRTAAWYVEKFLSMHEALNAALTMDVDGDGTADTLEFANITITLAGHVNKTGYRYGGGLYDSTDSTFFMTSEELEMRGQRVAQYWLASNPDLPEINLVCNLGESWVTMPDGSDGVAEYFATHYENGTVDYTTQVQQSASWYTPTTPKEVKDSIHYNQIGYNEVGREAARNTLILLGEVADTDEETTVTFYDWSGYQEVSSVAASTIGKSETLVVPVVYPCYRAKTVTYQVSDGLHYDYFDLTTDSYAATGTLTAIGAEGSVAVVMAEPGAHYAGHLSQLPEDICRGVNLWTALEHDKYYYTSGSAWGIHSSGNVYSVTIPVAPGDRIYASSFGAAGTNGHSSTSGIRVTWFSAYGVAKTMTPSEVYAEFSANGYLTAPEDAVAINIPMWTNSDEWEVYILNLPHDTAGEICSICGKDSHTHTWSDWETVTAPSIDGPGTEQRACACGEVETREVEGVWQTLGLSDHMSAMPESCCAGTNLWTALAHDKYFFNGSTSWTIHSSGTVYSVTIPVSAGDRIFATSFGASSENGGSKNGIRVTFFDAYGVAKTLAPADTYAEFTANGGYLIAPEGTVAVNIPMWTNADTHEIYILNREHSYENGVCLGCGAAQPAPIWESGTIASATGLNNANTTRLRTADYLRMADYGGVGIDPGYTMTVFAYDADRNYLGTTSWLGNGVSLHLDALRASYPDGIYFRIALRTLDSAVISVDQISNTGVTFYAPGEVIPVPEGDLAYTDVGSIGTWQDGAVWDGKLFVLGGSGTGSVYDLTTLTNLGSLTLDQKDVLKPHANSVCFGSTYYAEGDKYPLLYVNIYNNYASAEDRMEGTCCVYRVTEADGSFATELVQVIRIGFTEDLTLWKSKENNGDVRPYGNFVVDTDNGKLYAFVMRDADKTTRFFCFDIPALTEGEYSETYGCNVVTLESTDIESRFDTVYFNYLQGCTYTDGKIISAEGFNSGGSAEPALRIVDPESGTVEKTYYPAEAGLTKEPEVVCADPVTGKVYYAAADGVLRILTLPEVEQETESDLWNGKSAVFVGDSITAGSGTDKIYYQYLNEIFNFGSVTAMGVAGSCISAASDYGQSNQPLINRYENIPSADLIVIFMGTNDYGHETPIGSVEDTGDGSFYGALNEIIPALVEKHSSGKIVFVTPMHRYGFGTSKILGTSFTYDSEPNGVGATLGDYVEALKTVCTNHNVSVIDLYTECTLDPSDSEIRATYMPDGLHPNATGHELIAGIMASHIRTYTPSEEAPETEVQTELVYGNKFASGYTQHNRASSRVNLYLEAGTVITLNDPTVFQWACAVTSDENSSNNLGYFPDSGWSDQDTAVVETDAWVGFVFKYRDETQEFDLSRLLSDYITIEAPHTHTYEATVTEPTCTEQGYTTYTCECGDSYVDDYVDALGHDYSGTTCTICGSEHPEAADYEGKVISILGGSTCTFEGYIPVADGFNLAHRARYPQDNLLTDVNETWWMQVIAELDAKLGINDSWAGSQVLNTQDTNSGDLGPDAAMASLTRIQNLGSNGTPDMILFYGAMNDIGRAVAMGNFDAATAPAQVDLTATKWDNLADAYVAAILRMQYYYPDARIVAILPGPTASYYTEAERQAYCEVLKAICDHYGVPTVDLSTCGLATANMPDGTHPNAEGMDYITTAVLETLLGDCSMEPGENVVHSVTHELSGAKSSLGHYKGITDGESFVTTITGENVTVTVTMGGMDITEQTYADGIITIPAVTGDIRIVAQGDYNADGRLQQLPGDYCRNTNLWTALEPVNEYYTASGWGNNNNSNYSVTFPVTAGDRIWATSFGAAGTNGYSADAVRITWFTETGVLESLSREKVYAEFAENGCITVPEGAVAVNIPMSSSSDTWEIYILNADHIYENGLCTICGTHLPGDINGDGSVNNKDVTRLFQYLSGWDVEVVEDALDVNGDGSVNNKDVTRLFQYLSAWDTEIH